MDSMPSSSGLPRSSRNENERDPITAPLHPAVMPISAAPRRCGRFFSDLLPQDGHPIPPWPVTPGFMGGKNPAEPLSRRDVDLMEAVTEGERRFCDAGMFLIPEMRI